MKKHKIGDKVVHIIDDTFRGVVEFNTRTIDQILETKAEDGSKDISYRFTGGDEFHLDWDGNILTVKQARKFLLDYIKDDENFL